MCVSSSHSPYPRPHFSLRSTFFAGAIYFVESSRLSVSGGSHFSGNVASNGGGAVSVATPHATIAATAGVSFDRVEFFANAADSGGAWILSSVGTSERKIDGCTFVENVAAGKGGAMYLLIGAGVVDVHDSLFEGNHAGKK